MHSGACDKEQSNISNLAKFSCEGEPSTFIKYNRQHSPVKGDDYLIYFLCELHFPVKGGAFFVLHSHIPIVYLCNKTEYKMKKPTKRLLWTEAYKLMNARTPDGKNKPFDIRFVCKDGTISECYNVQRAVSYNREKGFRKLVLPSGDIRIVYDVLILQINDTKILVK